MAYQTGIATDYRDLMDQFRAFITGHADLVAAGQEWAELRWAAGADTQELIIKGPGTAGSDEIYCGIKTWEDSTQARYIWEMNGFIGYNAANQFDDQPGAIPQSKYPPKMTLANASMAYWFVASGRRAVIVVKIGAIYEAAYLGFFIPYATPAEYPYPLFIGGSMTGENDQLDSSVETPTHRVFAIPGGAGGSQGSPSTASYRTQDGTWARPKVKYGSSSNEYTPSAGTVDFVLPYGDYFSPKIRENLDGSYTLKPIIPARSKTSTAHGFQGELDGCYFVSGFGNASENIVQIGGIDHLVIQNVYRTDTDDFWALKLE